MIVYYFAYRMNSEYIYINDNQSHRGVQNSYLGQ